MQISKEKTKLYRLSEWDFSVLWLRSGGKASRSEKSRVEPRRRKGGLESHLKLILATCRLAGQKIKSEIKDEFRLISLKGHLIWLSLASSHIYNSYLSIFASSGWMRNNTLEISFSRSRSSPLLSSSFLSCSHFGLYIFSLSLMMVISNNLHRNLQLYWPSEQQFVWWRLRGVNGKDSIALAQLNWALAGLFSKLIVELMNERMNKKKRYLIKSLPYQTYWPHHLSIHPSIHAASYTLFSPCLAFPCLAYRLVSSRLASRKNTHSSRFFYRSHSLLLF